MAHAMDVWIVKQGNACRVDDGSWKVTVYDAHDKVYEWAGGTYADLPAPKGHWTGTIPPGTYVVRAKRDDGKESTDRAVVTVDGHAVSLVRLYVAPPPTNVRPGLMKDVGPMRPVGRPCRVGISNVVGSGVERLKSIRVEGTASNCRKLQVSVAGSRGQAAKTEATVGANGKWTATLEDIEGLRLKCGAEVKVTARCPDEPNCLSTYDGKLHCEPSPEEMIPK